MYVCSGKKEYLLLSGRINWGNTGNILVGPNVIKSCIPFWAKNLNGCSISQRPSKNIGK